MEVREITVFFLIVVSSTKLFWKNPNLVTLAGVNLKFPKQTLKIPMFPEFPEFPHLRLISYNINFCSRNKNKNKVFGHFLTFINENFSVVCGKNINIFLLEFVRCVSLFFYLYWIKFLFLFGMIGIIWSKEKYFIHSTSPWKIQHERLNVIIYFTVTFMKLMETWRSCQNLPNIKLTSILFRIKLCISATTKSITIKNSSGFNTYQISIKISPHNPRYFIKLDEKHIFFPISYWWAHPQMMSPF